MNQRSYLRRVSSVAEADMTIEAIAQRLLDRIVTKPGELVEAGWHLMSSTAFEATLTSAGAVRGLSDEEAPELCGFDLSDREGRLGFLYALFMHHYRDGLFLAVQHVWASLARPKAARCKIMAQRLELTGVGKIALKNVLAAFLQETLYGVNFPALPDIKDYADSDVWHAACSKHFEGINAQFEGIYRRYEAILDGRDDDGEANAVQVIKGPWSIA